ncbi:MAG: hypothetical protein M1826_003076 [Phylliscum demangeonii]|nr:MAG: hypothetical protein M1826_003076 [Phylliscum demangeonii]
MDRNIVPMSRRRKRGRHAATGVQDNADDVDITPRARFVPPPLSTASSSASSARSNVTKRSASPIKRLADTLLQLRPIVLQNMSTIPVGRTLPGDLPVIASVLRRVSRGREVMAESRRFDVKEVSRDRSGFAEIDADDAFATGPSRDIWGTSPTAAAVAHIVEMATECDREGLSEAHWNCFVHAPLLQLALQAKDSAAQIQPHALVEPTRAGKPGDRKVVDFVICLRPNQLELDAMRTHAARCPPHETPTVNQTWHGPLQHCPIVVSIKTKRPGEGGDQAMLQTGRWSSAQLTKLTQMMRQASSSSIDDDGPIPPLPLLVVDGHQWIFWAAAPSTEVAGQTNVWGHVSLGNTSAPLGVYQVAAALQYLAHWSTTVYRPWFFREVIPVKEVRR